MPRNAWLTIDDTPTADTNALLDALLADNIPALLFIRGARAQERPDEVRRAIRDGFTIGNHSWNHLRSSEISLETVLDEIDRTEDLIDQFYQQENTPRGNKYFRFPHMDRGMAGYIVDYAQWPEYEAGLSRAFREGLNVKLPVLDNAMRDKAAALQEALKTRGYKSLPAETVTLDWYKNTDVAQAIDAMYTFSTNDWMLTNRHKGKHAWKTLQDLKDKIDVDPDLQRSDTGHIILMHDDEDGLLEVTLALLAHFKLRNFQFQKFD